LISTCTGFAFATKHSLFILYFVLQQSDRGLTKPDCIIYLDLPVDTAAGRGEFGAERYEKADMQKRVGEQFTKVGSITSPSLLSIITCFAFATNHSLFLPSFLPSFLRF
jgi:dTMP kinase